MKKAKPLKKLAIVGLGRGSHDAPRPNKRWDVWRLNPGFWHCETPATLWYEIHTRRYLTTAHGNAHIRGLIHLLNAGDAPCYFLNAAEWPEVRNRLSFPRSPIAKMFPRGDYHAGSFDWVLANAIRGRYQHVEFFGVNLGPTDSGEPLSARACLEYWIGIGEGRGMSITVQEPTGLFWIYNYTRERTPYHYDDTWRLIEERK